MIRKDKSKSRIGRDQFTAMLKFSGNFRTITINTVSRSNSDDL